MDNAALTRALSLANRYCQAKGADRETLLSKIRAVIGRGNKIPLTVLNNMGENVSWNSPVRFVP